MKFAKQLQNDRVAEYAEYYLNYKLGKKKIKTFSTAKRRGVSDSSQWRSVQAAQDVNAFLQGELKKVEKFYREKEQAAIDRMLDLKLQFNIYHEQLFLRQQAAEAQNDQRRDYVRAPANRREARKKLKIALVEFYRGLEILRSFVLLNSTAFRKLNKKFDKATGERPPLCFYNTYVEHAHFYQSNAVEELTWEVEELFAHNYERDNRKAAIDELKSKSLPDWKSLSNAMFADGLFLGLGSVLAVIGLTEGLSEFFTEDQVPKIETAYLLQLYAGYFLIWLLMVMFCVNCLLWNRSRINYVFIFQLNGTHCLNWRELLVIPMFLFFLFGGSMFITFYLNDNSTIRTYIFVILIALSLFTMLLPAPTLYHHTRKWLIKHIGRLALSPFYPVTFADFFLGDLFCSLSYSMGNIELFFCLYGHSFSNPTQCNSSQSRLLGFFSALPAVWRALQCLRRYHDSRQWMPHLPNFGKYLATCLNYTFLSIYRFNPSLETEATYIAFASINTIYTIFWDVKLDWSLANTEEGFLREDLTFTKHKWVYYLAIVEDAVIRSNWVAYIAVSRYPQHSSAVAFFVALSEVLRRGIWMIFRVENEHWGNVRLTNAYRDPPLPYKAKNLESAHDEGIASGAHVESMGNGRTAGANWKMAGAAAALAAAANGKTSGKANGKASGVKRGGGENGDVPLNGLRKRGPTLERSTTKGSVLNDAHMQDYVRFTQPDSGGEDTSEEEDDEDGDDRRRDPPVTTPGV